MFNVGGSKRYLIGVPALLGVVGILCFILVVLSFSKNLSEDKDYSVEVLFETNVVYEVRVYDGVKGTSLYIDGKHYKTLTNIPRQGVNYLELPVIETSENTLQGKESEDGVTWESSLEESVKYLNFLQSQGYKIIQKAHTPQFVEIITEFNETRRRIIIFRHIIMVGDLYQDARLPTINDYLKYIQDGVER